jgi:drug/metabolite transporter (DMT)-like permease
VNFRKYLVLLAIIVFGSCGDVLLARGMRDVGQVNIHQTLQLFHALTNPWVLLGVGCLLIFFTSYSTALSWADLTFVLPSTAVGYVVLALLSHFFLHEQISFQRWAGILLIVAGVGFVAGGPAQTARVPEPEEPQPCPEEHHTPVVSGAREGQV